MPYRFAKLHRNREEAEIQSLEREASVFIKNFIALRVEGCMFGGRDSFNTTIEVVCRVARDQNGRTRISDRPSFGKKRRGDPYEIPTLIVALVEIDR